MSHADPLGSSAEQAWPSRALVLGASGAIGSALVRALGADCDVMPLSRSGDGLELTDERSVASAAQRVDDDSIDLVFIATGALELDGVGPEKSLQALDPSAMARQFAVNTIGPALALKHFERKLARGRRVVCAVLSARVGSIADNRLGGWVSYRAAKAALNQVVRTAAIEFARKRPQAIVVALHPGTVRSALTARYLARHPAVEPVAAAAHLLAVTRSLTVADSGRFFAWDGKPIAW